MDQKKYLQKFADSGCPVIRSGWYFRYFCYFYDGSNRKYMDDRVGIGVLGAGKDINVVSQHHVFIYSLDCDNNSIISRILCA